MDALRKYLKQHPGADKSKHTVEKSKSFKTNPASPEARREKAYSTVKALDLPSKIKALHEKFGPDHVLHESDFARRKHTDEEKALLKVKFDQDLVDAVVQAQGEGDNKTLRAVGELLEHIGHLGADDAERSAKAKIKKVMEEEGIRDAILDARSDRL